MSKHGSGSSQILHTLSSKGTMLVAGFAVGIFTSRFLGPEGRGALALLLTVPMLSVAFGEFGIRQSVAYMAGRNTFSRETIRSTLMLLFYGTGTLSLIVVFITDVQMGLLRHGMVALIAVAGIAPITLYQNYLSGFLVAEKRLEQINTMQLLTPLVLFGQLALLALLGYLTLTNAALSFLVAQAAGCIYLVSVSRLSPRPGLHRDALGAMLKMGMMYAAGLFIQSLNYRADVLILGSLSGESSVGIYSVGVSLCETIKMAPLSVGMVLFSRSVNVHQSDAERLLSRALLASRCTLVVTLAIALFLALFAGWLIPLLYGSAFSPSIYVIWALLPGVVALSVFVPLHLFVSGQGYPQLSIYAFLPALLVNVSLNFILIPHYDYVGSAVASTISYTFGTLVYLLLFLRKYRLSVGALLPSRMDVAAIMDALQIRFGGAR